jgi:O-succinylbenzoic acid--CoA ligase
MITKLDLIHPNFALNGKRLGREELIQVAYSLVKEGLLFEKAIGSFLLDWLDRKAFVMVKTSGSTGTPKVIRLSKQAMVNSAKATGGYFQLQPGDTALHCLPMQYIAGQMMLVRALVLGLEIDMVEPRSKPVFSQDKPYRFCAMLPMQLESTIDHLQHIDILIVGGAPVSKILAAATQKLQTKIYVTYGMTETVTHIALKPINNDVATPFFEVLPSITISQDDRQCLVIEAPEITTEIVITNDIVIQHSPTTFEWLGRFDNVINSGGLKLFPEQIEAKLKEIIKTQFFIASEADDTLGERVILILEAENASLDTTIFEGLDKFEIPKKIYAVPEFVMTKTGKIQRKKTREKITF